MWNPFWIRGRDFFGPHTWNIIAWIAASRKPPKYPGKSTKIFKSQKSLTSGINTKQIAIPQQQIVIDSRGSEGRIPKTPYLLLEEKIIKVFLNPNYESKGRGRSDSP